MNLWTHLHDESPVTCTFDMKGLILYCWVYVSCLCCVWLPCDAISCILAAWRVSHIPRDIGVWGVRPKACAFIPPTAMDNWSCYLLQVTEKKEQPRRRVLAEFGITTLPQTAMVVVFIAWLSTFWIVVHLVNRIFRWLRGNPFLPAPPSRRSTSTLSIGQHTTLAVENAHLRVNTTAMNGPLDRLSSLVTRKNHLALRRNLSLFYDAGSVFGLLGILVGVCLLAWTCYTNLLAIYSGWGLKPSIGKFGKRALPFPTSLEAASTIKPIIPGITVPLSHLPSVLLAVFVGQVVHEAGHAICAALASIPLTSMGFSVFLLVPFAFVNFPASRIGELPPRTRVRIIAAGPWHNLAAWLLVYLAASAGSQLSSLTGIQLSLWPMLGYKVVFETGLSVVSVDSDSPLSKFLPVGAMLTSLDDMELNGTVGRDALSVWERYLKEGADPLSSGWCTATNLYTGSPTACCEEGQHGHQLTCFTSPREKQFGCLDAVSVMSKFDAPRCSGSGEDCASGFTCVHLRRPESLMRIRFRHPSWSLTQGEEIVLWDGPRSEVWDQVEVSIYAPPRFMPPNLPNVFSTFLDYLHMAMLSLYVLNLLPLPYLDGSQFLEAALDLSLPSGHSWDMEIGLSIVISRADEQRRRERIKSFVCKAASTGTTALFSVCILTSLIQL